MSNQDGFPFACDCQDGMRRGCKGEPFFAEHEGKRYCVLHFPGVDKKEIFDAAVEKKLASGDFNYQGVWFPNGTSFSGLEIPVPADFTAATFVRGGAFRKTVFRDHAHFGHASFLGDGGVDRTDFDSAVFAGPAYFGDATFAAGAVFDCATFAKEVHFTKARFAGTVGFRKVRFEEPVDFFRCTFTKLTDGDWVDFDEATFNGHANLSPVRFGLRAWFRGARFTAVIFGGSRFSEEAVFQGASFGGASFVGVTFRDQANFFSATFKGTVSFSLARFEAPARFTLATFSADALFWSALFAAETNFWNATFKDYVKFSGPDGMGFGNDASCDFQHARFEKPERVSFHSMTLRPHWFLNVDPRKFEFVDVQWNLALDLIGGEIEALRKKAELEKKEALKRREGRQRNAEMTQDEWEKEEMEKEEAERVKQTTGDETTASFSHLLGIACRQLAVNAEGNHRYDEASDFRFWSMELQRREGWRARGRLVSVLHNLYRYLSGYGEDVGRALGVLVGIWLLFALLYTQVGFVVPASPVTPDATTYTRDEVGMPLRCNEALAYSLATMTLQRPDPRPLTIAAKFTVLAETIFGPIQAALFALAVRRRFMR